MLWPSATGAPDGVPWAAAARVPRLASLAHEPSDPTVPPGSAIAHSPATIIAVIISDLSKRVGDSAAYQPVVEHQHAGDG